MTRSNLRSLLAFTVLLSPMVAACGPDAAGLAPADMERPDPSDPLPDADDGVRVLAIVGDHDVFLAENAQVQLVVRYLNGHGQPVAGKVELAIKDAATAAAGATVDASVPTSATGEARATLRAAHTGSFVVTANADGAAQVSWRISVTQANAPVRPLSFAGTFSLESELDLGGNLPGIVGGALRTLGDLTDGPNDPATYVVDFALDHIGSSTLTSLVNAMRPGLDEGLNGFLTSLAPELIGSLRQIGMDVTAVTRNFGIGSQLIVSEQTGPDGTTDGMTMRHTFKTIIFKLRGMRREFPMTMLDLGEPSAQNIAGHVSGETLTIAPHELQMSYGHLVLFALNNVVIPNLVTGATDTSSLLGHFIHCDGVATWIMDNIGLGSEAMWSSACTNAIMAVGSVVEGEILVLNSSAARLNIGGTAKAADKSNDRVIDSLTDGAWTGTFTLGSAMAPLTGAPTNTFIGSRLP